jgi:hypothetical protein
MIHSLDTLRVTGKVTFEGDCWIWNAATAGKGYGVVGDDRERYVHRLVFLLTHGRAAFPQAAHRCGRNACFFPDHVYETDQVGNEADKVRHGRTIHGDRNGMRTRPDRHPVRTGNQNYRSTRRMAGLAAHGKKDPETFAARWEPV